MKTKFAYIIASFLLIAVVFQILAPTVSQATLVDDLQKQIDERNKTIAGLEKEIAQFEAQVSLTAKQAATLKGLISTLDTTKKKLDAQIKVTQNRIAATELTINKLGGEIVTQEDAISQNDEALSETIQNLSQIQDSLNRHILAIKDLKQGLQNKQTASQKSKLDLLSFKTDLSSQKAAVIYSAQEKNKLLTETKSQEATYQTLLAQKKTLRDAVSKELNDIESQLKIAIDPNSVPAVKDGVLAWPLSKVIITQYFGNTAFAKANAGVYNGQGHNGIDLGVSIGTPVKASLSGTISGQGTRIPSALAVLMANGYSLSMQTVYPHCTHTFRSYRSMPVKVL
jgi:murein DD-endopeptidase MepM/ murein hydrolase activator NlpD